MLWIVPCTKISGAIRVQFLQWVIPKVLRAEFGIKDGDRLSITVSHLQYCETLELLVTSGGEIRLPTKAARILEAQARQSPDSAVTFALGGEYQSQSSLLAFERAVSASRNLAPEARRARLQQASRSPKRRIVQTWVFDRNPDVVAEVLERARGCCERCSNPAPFIRRSDGTPYLEVHHIDRLAHGGEDAVENAKALCPNCHRESHFGV